ncbi:glycoside hydrolase family protein [Moritella yayanosii]|uniref:Lysozyme n=1 Tax=Moritella yayanosii TaxID=69539 RepID=A0A330LJD1_9GAMM|nr:glycoside hydrolase family protein [Moritella yayanosii]SQD76522.1 putative phage-related lysozyme [Moritella yayanosii]
MKKIIASVGNKGKNNLLDVKVVQGLLNQHKLVGFPIILKIDGKSGPNTVKRIEAFQKNVLKMIRPDGLVDANGKTFKHLVAIKVGTKSSISMFFGQKGINLLKSIEELATSPYDDQTGKDITVWIEGATIGYGHLIAKSDWSKYKDGLTETEALSLFKGDLSPFVNTIKNKVKVSVTQNEFDAMVILAFNIGQTGFSSSSVLKMVNDPLTTTSYTTLEKAWKAWDKSQGKVSRGLTNRRQAEWNIYNKGVYAKW